MINQYKDLLWPAPAKLNLFLHITGRREDGYHFLQTLFQLIDYCDDLFFTPNNNRQIELLSPLAGVKPEQNLIVQAAQLLKKKTGYQQGVDIRIHKRIPVGGGLGGGSSNAATTLCALNHCWSTGLSTNELAELGLQLGADVPVFIKGYSAWAEGIGEILTQTEVPCPWFLIVKPNISVNTANIFSSKELTRECQPIRMSDFLSVPSENVCESVVRQKYPEVGAVIDWLNNENRHILPPGARMSGTGSCVFAAFNSWDFAQSALDELPVEWKGFIARGLNKSPLLERLDKK